MALSKPRLSAALLARMKPLHRTEGPSDRAQDADYWLEAFCDIIAEEVIDEFITNARLTGNDSDGDSLPNVRII